MSIDTTFHPITQTVLVGAAAVQVSIDTQLDATTFRVRCLVAAYLTWGTGSGITAKGAPAAGLPVFNTIGLAAGGVIYIEVPSNSFFIASAPAAFEITGGKGGVGG